MNGLYYGDNLAVLRESIASESVDLIYLDPPFNSQATYNILFRSPAGQQSQAQIEAFEDTWHWTTDEGGAADAFDQVMRSGNTTAADMLRALHSFLGENDMMAYLAMMAVRLIELHRVLKSTGAIYLHCDPTASHYLKVIMDGIFGPENFRSEIIWRRNSSHNSTTRQFGPVHDTILFYARTDTHRLRTLLMPHLRSYIAGEFRFTDGRGSYRLNEIMGPGSRQGDSGKPWRGYDPTPKGRHWAIPESLRSLIPDRGAGTSLQQQLDALMDLGEIYISPAGRPKYKQRPTLGVPLQDIWAYQPGTEGTLNDMPNAIDADVKWLDNEEEKLGYPTQKPVGLLSRIILSSTEEGDVVLDPFCGCGTAVHAAHKLKRLWIGIDVTHLAISLIERRLKDAFPGIQFEVHGTPKDLDGARDLAARDKYQFQWWAVSLVDAQPFAGKKKGADGGIDGLIYFRSDSKTTERAIVSVKGGDNVSVSMIRDLKGVLEREKAPIGVFLTLVPPTRPMEAEAASAGFYELGERRYPRLQIITIEQALAGTKPAIPLVDTGAAFKRPSREASAKQQKLNI
jgi:site-specific DNA-methyltransferase (adenine-specific)